MPPSNVFNLGRRSRSHISFPRLPRGSCTVAQEYMTALRSPIRAVAHPVRAYVADVLAMACSYVAGSPLTAIAISASKTTLLSALLFEGMLLVALLGPAPSGRASFPGNPIPAESVICRLRLPVLPWSSEPLSSTVLRLYSSVWSCSDPLPRPFPPAALLPTTISGATSACIYSVLPTSSAAAVLLTSLAAATPIPLAAVLPTSCTAAAPPPSPSRHLVLHPRPRPRCALVKRPSTADSGLPMFAAS